MYMYKDIFLKSKSEIKNTCRCYQAALNQFFSDCKKSETRVQSTDALKHVIKLEQKYAWATVRNRVGALVAFYDFLIAIRKIKSNPFRDIRALIPRRQRIQVRPTATLSVDVIRAMQEKPPPDTREGVRDRAILAALFGGGLRRSEVVSLDIGDIETTCTGELCLRLTKTKAGIVQYQILSNRFAETIVELVSQRKSEGATNCDPLFINYNRHGGRICARTIARMFSHYAAECGVHAAPHAARAAAITQLLRAGASVIDVKRFSRHARLDSLEAYDKRDKVANIEISRQLIY